MGGGGDQLKSKGERKGEERKRNRNVKLNWEMEIETNLLCLICIVLGNGIKMPAYLELSDVCVCVC